MEKSIRSLQILALSLGLAVAGISQNSFATTYTWDGGGANGSWSTAANWNPDGAPGATGNSLVFAGTTNLSAVNDLVTTLGSSSFNFLSGAGSFVLSGNAITVGNGGGNDIFVTQASANDQTIALNITLAGGGRDRQIVMSGAGKLILSGNINYNGDWLFPTTTAGTIVLSGNNSGLGKTGGINAGTNTLRAMMRNNVDGTVIVLGSDTALGDSGTGSASAGTAVYNGIINNTGTLNITTQGGNRNLSGNTLGLTSGTKISFNGTNNLTIGNIINGDANKDLWVTSTGQLTVSSGLFLSSSQTGRELYVNLSGAGGMVVSGSVYDTFYSGGVTSGAGKLRKAGTGTLILNGSSAYTALTTIEGGTLQLGNANAVQNSTVSVQVANGLAFDNATSGTSTYNIGNIASTGSFALTLSDIASNAVTINVGSNGSSQTYSGAIGGTGALTKVGTGALTLSGSNTYSGGTTIKAGTIIQTAVSALGTGAVTLGDGSTSNSATLQGNVSTTNTNAITIAAGGSGTYTIANVGGSDYNFSAPITLNNAATFQTTSGGAMLLSGAITGSSKITIDGGTTTTKFVQLSVSSAGTFTGNILVQNKGTLKFGADNALSTSTAVTMDSTATIDAGGKALTFAGLNDVVAGAGGSSVLDNGSGLTLGGTGTYSFSGVISSGGALTKSGVGTQTLAGSNTYGGGTTVNGGTLKAGNSSAFSTGAVSVVNSGATLDLNGNTIANALTIAGTGVGGNGALINSNTGSAATVTGNITNSNFTAGGAGDMTLTVMNSANTGGTFTVTKTGAGMLTLGGSTLNYLMALTVNSGTVVLAKTGGNWAIDRGATVNGGTLKIGAVGEQIQTDQGITVNGGTFDLGGYSTPINSLAGTGGIVTNSGSSAVTLTVGATQFSSNGPSTSYSGTITDGTSTLALTKNGTGTFTVSGSNTYGGGTTLNGGTLKAGNSSAFGTGAIALANASGTLDLNGNSIGNTLNVNTAGTLSNTSASSGSLTKDANVNSDFTVNNNGDITTQRLIGNAATRTITKTGAGTLTSAGSSYNNLIAWQINQGTVVFANSSGYAADRGVTIAGGTLKLSGLNSDLINNGEAFTINSGTFDLNGKAEAVASVGGSGGIITNTNASAASLYVGGGNGGTSSASYGGVIQDGSGTLALIKEGTGTQTFTGSNTYTGATTVSGGTLQIGSGGTTGSISGTSGVTDNGTLAYNRSNSLSVAYGISGSGAVNQIGAGTTTLTANNSYGSTLISNGVLQVGAGGTTGTLGTGTVTDNASLVFNRSNAMTVANTISGSGSLTQAGAGTTELTGNNSYSGTTTISSGTLKINGLHSGAGAYTVQGGGTLGGSGTITMAAGSAGISFASGAKLSPGNSPGTLTVNLDTGVFDISNTVTGSSMNLEFDLVSLASYDRVLITGNGTNALEIGNGVLGFNDFAFNTSGWDLATGVYTLFDTNKAISGSLSSVPGALTGTLAGLNATISFGDSGRDIILTVTAVPEPATYGALAGLLLSGLSLTSVVRRRRKRTTV